MVASVKRVLCAVDVDAAEEHVFASALALCRSRDATLVILHAAAPDRPLLEGATERVEFLRHLRARAEAAQVEVRVTVQQGDPATVIAAQALNRRIDLIVVGAPRSRGGRLAGVAEDVLRRSACPTLIVPREGTTHGVFERILCAVDLSCDSSAAVDAALLLAARDRCRVNLLHVVGGPDGGAHGHEILSHAIDARPAAAALGHLQTVMPSAGGGAVLGRVATGHPVAEIQRAIRTLDAELLVLGVRRNATGTRAPFSTTRPLLDDVTCPILAAPLVRSPNDRQPLETVA
jgi:nucleotide-binding universal stress UspA family protein